MLADIIVSGHKVAAPLELIEHYYKKEYGLTTHEFMNEPSDRVGWFLKIRELEVKRDEQETNKLKRNNG